MNKNSRATVAIHSDYVDDLSANEPVHGTLWVASAAVVIGLVSALWVWWNDWFFLLVDAQEHLIVARRVFDPSLGGDPFLGTTWMPFPHLLLIPFSASYSLWESGWGGAIVGITSLAVSATALWRIGHRLGITTLPMTLGVSLFLLNPSLLYIFTTAVSEPVLIAAVLSSVAGLARWITATRAISAGEVAIFAGIPAAIALLTRYEGWIFFGFAALIIVVASLQRWRNFTYTATMLAAFVSPGLFLMLWWIAYNWVRLGDPFYFLGSDPREVFVVDTSGGVWNSFTSAITSLNLRIVEVIGWPVIAVAALSLLVLLLTNPFRSRNYLVWLLLFVYPLGVVFAWANVALFRDVLPIPYSFTQARYSLLALPALALLIAFGAQWILSRSRPLGRIVVSAGLLMVIIGFVFQVSTASENAFLLEEAIRFHELQQHSGGAL